MERVGDEALRTWRVIESALDSFLQIGQVVSVEPWAAWGSILDRATANASPWIPRSGGTCAYLGEE